MTCADSLKTLNKHFILVENKSVDFMCPILSSFSRSVNTLSKQTAEPLQRLEHVGYQFDELDPQHTPVKNIYSECIQNDIIFQNIKRKGNRGVDDRSLSNLMSARQEARSRTPKVRDGATPDKKDSSSIMNLFSKIRSKTPTHKRVPLDDVSSFLDSSNLGEFSQIGKEKTGKDGGQKSRKDESYYTKDNWEESYRNDPKRALQQIEKTRVDDTRFDPYDKSKGPVKNQKASQAHYDTTILEESKVGKSQSYSRSKTPTKPPNKSIWDSTDNQAYMNETAAMSYVKPNAKNETPKVPIVSTKELGLTEEIDIATQVKLLEEAAKKHKEAQRKKEEERLRTAQYFSSPAPAQEARRPNPYADNSRSHLNSTMMTGMNDRSMHRGPPQTSEQPSMAKSSTTAHPFGEFLDCNLSLTKTKTVTAMRISLITAKT